MSAQGPGRALGHIYPHFGRPSPAIDFLNEMLRWWDHWLKGKNTGVEDDPMICAWMQDSAPPNPEFEYRDGRWIAEETWPSPSIAYEPFTLSNHRGLVAGEERVTEAALDVQSPVTLGLFSGKWCSYANGPDLASDQRADDGGSLVFQTEPLEEDVEIFGAPYLELASDRPVAMVAVRLSDVQPDHQVARVTYGLLNLTHRDSRQHPEELEPGKRYRVRVQMNDIAHAFPKGHSIKISVSTLYWPMAWPSPEPVKLTLWTGESRMFLPVRPKRDEKEIVFGEPVTSPARRRRSFNRPIINESSGRIWQSRSPNSTLPTIAG